MSAKSHNLAKQYFRRLGKSASSPECDTLGNCISQLIDLGVFSSLQEIWIHRSAYNLGSGASVSGVLGRAAMVLTATPTWGTNGITFNGTTQYGSATIPTGTLAGSLIVVCQGDVTGQAAFGTPGSIVAAAGRSAAGGGTVGSIYHNNLGGLQTDAFTGALQTDQLAFNPGVPITSAYFRFLAFANDGGTAMANWVDTYRTPHVTPRTTVNLNTMVTNAAGYDNPGYSLFYKGTFAATLAFNSALTDAQMQAIYRILRTTICSGLLWTQTVTVEGDSQAAATNNAADTDRWHYKLIQTPGTSWGGKAYRNVQAVGGQTAVQRLAAYSSAVTPWIPKALEDRSWFILCEGINDIAADAKGQDVWTTVAAHLALARRDGFRTMLMTLPAHQTLTGFQEVQRRLYNDIAISQIGRRAYDVLIDLATTFKTWDASLYNDSVHLNPAANTTVANLIVAQLPTP